MGSSVIVWNIFNSLCVQRQTDYAPAAVKKKTLIGIKATEELLTVQFRWDIDLRGQHIL